MRLIVHIFAVMLLSCAAVAAGSDSDDPPETKSAETARCCSECEFGTPCCVCKEYDYVVACSACTPKAKSPEIPTISLRSNTMPKTETLKPPLPLLQPTILPRLSLVFLQRWSSTSPRSPKTPKTGSPKSANSNSKDSPRTPRTVRFSTATSSSDAEIDDSF